MKTLTTKNHNGRTVTPWLRDFFNVENLFDRDIWNSANTTMPAVNISEDDKNYFVDVMAPGYKKEDFKVDVNDDVLTINAESKSESETKDRHYSRRESNYSSFTRSFRLPENAKDDAINASYKDGVLKLNIPKSEVETKASKNIRID